MRNITVVGDSITEGNHLATYAENWPYKLCARLNTVTSTAHFTVTDTQDAPASTTNKYAGERFTVWNAGVHSQTSTLVEARYAADVLGHDSDVDVILIGVNDIALGVDIDAVTKVKIEAMVDASIGAGRDVILCTLTPWPAGDPTEQATLVSLNAWIKTWGPDNGCTVVDLNAANPAMQADNVHPTAAGCTTMANAFTLTDFYPYDLDLLLLSQYDLDLLLESATATCPPFLLRHRSNLDLGGF